jgi:hypothetical protein
MAILRLYVTINTITPGHCLFHKGQKGSIRILAKRLKWATTFVTALQK